ncbi:unnamed protein product [Urochloa humidicola]
MPSSSKVIVFFVACARTQVEPQHAGRRDGVAAGDVQDWNGDGHVRHGPVHGARSRKTKIIACGPGLAALGMALRCASSSARSPAMLVGAAAATSCMLVAIIQAALPQSTASFVFAKEYEPPCRCSHHGGYLRDASVIAGAHLAYYAVLGIVQ